MKIKKGTDNESREYWRFVEGVARDPLMENPSPSSGPRGRIVEQLIEEMERAKRPLNNAAVTASMLEDWKTRLAALRDLPASEGQEDRSQPMTLATVDRAQPMERDAIVAVADAVRTACVLRIRRAIAAAKGMGVMPLNAEECATLLEHSTLEKLISLPVRSVEPPS